MSAEPDSFDNLLSQPPSARIQQFRDFAVAHPLLVEAKRPTVGGHHGIGPELAHHCFRAHRSGEDDLIVKSPAAAQR